MKRFRVGNIITTVQAVRLYIVVVIASLQACSVAFAALGEDTPVTPNASPQVQSLLSYFRTTYGNKILSGQQDSTADEDQLGLELKHIKEVTGNLPAIRAFDFMQYTPPSGSIQKTPRLVVTQQAIDWYVRSNGIVALCWHWRAPIGAGAIYTKDTSFDLQRGVTEGTPEHAAIIRDLDAIADELKKLRDAHVPVLWRPLHEANGRWFWWGAQGRSEPFKELWRLMFDRFVNYHKLNNLIWVYSPGAAVDLADWYPGDEYVDIIGQDNYPMDGNDGPAKDIFDQLVALGHGEKMVALSENGPIPDPNRLLSAKAGWLYFTTWSGKSLAQFNSDEHLNKAYNHPYVVNLRNLPNLKNYPFKEAGNAVRLGFLSPPGDLAIDRAGHQPVTVAVQDAGGQTVRVGEFVVKLVTDSNSDNGTMGDILTADTVNGIATFPDLKISKPSIHCTITASAQNLASVTSPVFRVGPGNGILHEWWTNTSARQISEIANPYEILGRPAGSEVLGAAFEVPYSLRTNFAERICGCLSPPFTGNYEFEIVSDGSSELWLSSDKTPDKKVKLTEITSRTPYSKWPHSHEGWSAPVILEVGKCYYVEALHLQNSGGGQFSVNWRLPNGILQQPIPAARFSTSEVEWNAENFVEKSAEITTISSGNHNP